VLRQIHPGFVQDGRPSSQAFRPTPKDEQKLSVYDGDQITPANAFEHYTQALKPGEQRCDGSISGGMQEARTACDTRPKTLPGTCVD